MRTDPATDWMAQGACVGENPDLFFEKAGEDHAKALCESCPVKRECLDYALAERIVEGVWGGFSETERRARGGRRKPIEHGTYAGYRMHLRRGELACADCLEANAAYQWAKKERPQYKKCAHDIGRACQQWALKGGDLCWVHAGKPTDA